MEDKNVLMLGNVQIREDEQGRYCLNDLHKAAVAAGHDYKTCQVEHFTRNETTQALVAELLINGELESEPLISTAGRYGGTWARKHAMTSHGRFRPRAVSL